MYSSLVASATVRLHRLLPYKAHPTGPAAPWRDSAWRRSVAARSSLSVAG